MQSSLENVVKLEQKVDHIESNMNALQCDNNERKSEVKIINNKNEILQKRCDVLEHYAFQSNCEIRGIPFTKDEDLIQIIAAISSKIGFNFDISMIKYSHRIFSTKPPKPIVVEFNSKFVRNNFIDCVKLRVRHEQLNAKDFGFVAFDSPIFQLPKTI